MGARRPKAAGPPFWAGRPEAAPPLLTPEAPGPGGLGGRNPARKARGSGGREPPRRDKLIYLVADFTDGVTNDFLDTRDE